LSQVYNGVEAHQNGTLQPMLRAVGAATRRFVRHSSLRAHVSAGHLAKVQAPRVRNTLHSWARRLGSSITPQAPQPRTPPTPSSSSSSSSSPSTLLHTADSLAAARVRAACAACVVPAGVSPSSGVVRVRETHYSGGFEKTGNVLVGRG
jgi:hypothetical protein